MQPLLEQIGRERSLPGLLRELKYALQDLGPPVVGALHLTCADEAELETAQAFRHAFAREFLPPLKRGRHAPFRLANLGGRYEEGAVHVAEAHFATGAARDSFKALIVKVDAHVGVGGDGTFGGMERYGVRSPCCGALDALLSGSRLPFARELADAFGNRLALLREADQRVRPLLAAAVNARVQADRVVADALARPPSAPTVYVVLDGVTLNRAGPDSAILCGVHVVDRRTDRAEVARHGFGDDPRRLAPSWEDGRLQLSERDTE